MIPLSLYFNKQATLSSKKMAFGDKWYATAKSSKTVTLKMLGKEITQRCTVNHADTLAVLEALTQLLAEHLEESEIIRFSDFGSFQVGIGSSGAESAESL